MILAKDIELFKNLSQEEYNGKYFDFHNDFKCVSVNLLANGILNLHFWNIFNGQVVILSFSNVSIEIFEFFNYNKVENLTIDNLYRGKIEVNGKLIEFKNDINGYFYLEFDEGQKMEFWSSGISVKN